MNASTGDQDDASKVPKSAYSPSFEAVLTAARNGEGRAFDQLYKALSNRVLGFARARGAADPEGLVNDVFLRVFTSLLTFSGNEAQFNAWVFRIARNKMIDEARARDRRPREVSDDTGAVASMPASDDVEARVAEQLSTEALTAQLESLTEQQRDVVLLRVVSDLSVEAIGEIIGKRPGAVKAMQRRAFRALARNLSLLGVPL